MKTKIVSISSLLFVLIFTAGCGLLPGSSSTPPSTPVGPINSNYSNAISPAQQLILGTMNLQGNLVVTLDEATQLLPFWEAYKDLSTSNTASPLELQATLLGVEQAMTPAQVQAIVNMKLTSQDMATILQQQGVTSGARGGSGTPRATGAGGGGFGGGGGGGIPGVTSGGGGGSGSGGISGGGTPNPQAIATLRARASTSAANAGLVSLVIKFLQKTNPSLAPSATPSAIPSTATPAPTATLNP
ncbi:MAG: hypothetical protein WCA79_20525 [Anaerolineales bacterium]